MTATQSPIEHKPAAMPQMPPESEAAAQAVAERRTGVRSGSGLWASLLTLDGREMIRCAADNVGEGGMHLTSPVGYGFAVGQRYEVLLGRQDQDAPQSELLGEGHYATVVRTEFHMGTEDQPGRDHIGVGLRFDQPLVL